LVRVLSSFIENLNLL